MAQAQLPDQKSRTILIVEDEIFIRMISADMLSEEGYRVLEAESAEEALSILESGDTIELMFTDVRMPGLMNGLELAELVHERWPEIRLLVTSGHRMLTDNEIPDDGRFIVKPYRLDTVLSEVQHSLAGVHGGG